MTVLQKGIKRKWEEERNREREAERKRLRAKEGERRERERKGFEQASNGEGAEEYMLEKYWLSFETAYVHRMRKQIYWRVYTNIFLCGLSILTPSWQELRISFVTPFSLSLDIYKNHTRM